ncbi:hypothetical protein [Streptomyces sp. NPDC056061]|uniref:hypothetical protein n=1 Tax=Streptomyces sp. NPDC056061 TaxID=3345700 RepID=UPI0035DDE3DD
MKQRIEFKGFVTVDDEPLTLDEARRWVALALYRGDKHAEAYTTTLDDVVFFSAVGDDE